MWVMGSSNATNDVWYSANGMHWTCATDSAEWSGRCGHSSVVFNNKIWILGGVPFRNDVWYSSDGISWTCATNSAGWSPRWCHTSVIFDNKIWVLGGEEQSYRPTNDVWYSTDGINWTCATDSAGWSPRESHSSIVFDNKIWVLGGIPPYRNDVWYSSDGVNWTCATDSAEWSPRWCHTSVVFNNKMWVIGGNPGDPCSDLNDVWYSTGLGVEENHSLLSANRILLEVYPNPAKTYFTVRLPLSADHSEIKIYDVTGNIVKSEELKGKNNRISLDGIKNGLYFIQVGDKLISKKLIVTK
jgi:hypothetical protein